MIDLQPTLADDLVSLRPLRPDDKSALYRVASDPLIWEQHQMKDRWQPLPFDRFFEEALASGGALIISENPSGKIIGSSRYQRVGRNLDQLEIGWTFLARSHWGGKYNQAAKKLMINHAFRYFDQIIFIIDQDNIRSQKAVQKIGGRIMSDQEAAGLDLKSSNNLAFVVDRYDWSRVHHEIDGTRE